MATPDLSVGQGATEPKRKSIPKDSEEWKYDIESMIEDIQMSCPDIEDPELIYKDEEAILNRHLKDFYDLCDNMRVWIGLVGFS